MNHEIKWLLHELLQSQGYLQNNIQVI